MQGGIVPGQPIGDNAAHDRHAVLRSFHDQSRDLTDADEILTVLARILTDQLGVEHFLYGETATGDAAKLDIFHAAGGVQIEDPGGLTTIARAFERLAAGDAPRATRVVNDNRTLQRGPDDPTRGVAELLGTRSGIIVPIVKEGRMVAGMTVLVSVPRIWSQDEIELCEELAERLWATVARAHAETELRERERNRAALFDWSERVRGQSSSDAILSITLQWLGRQLGITRVTYSESDEAGGVFTVIDEWRDGVASNLGNSVSLDALAPEVRREWLGGALVRYDDVSVDPRVGPEATERYAAAQIRAFISVPLVLEGRMRSILSVQHRHARYWRDSEIELMREIAERSWMALERARAQSALHERERSQAFLIDWSDKVRRETSPAAILRETLSGLGGYLGVSRVNYIEGDPDGRWFTIVDQWNDDGTSTVGQRYPVSALGERVHSEYVAGGVVCYEDVATDPNVEDFARPLYLSVRAAAFCGIPLVRDGMVRAVLVLHHERPRRWLKSEVQLLRDVADRTWVILERARAEQALKERERNQAFLIEWSDTVRGETSPEAIMAATLEGLGRQLGVARTSYAETDATGRLFSVLDEWRDGVSSIKGNSFTLESVGASVDRAWVSGEVIRYDDVAADPRIEEAATARYLSREIASFVSIPLVLDGRMQSALSVQHPVARRWQDSEVQLMRDIAERTWVAIERARAQAALLDRQRSQAFLISWNDRIRSESSARKILSHTLAQLGTHLGVGRTNFAEATPDGQTLCVLQEWKDGEVGFTDERYPLSVLGERLAAAHSSGEAVRVDDVATDPRFDEKNRPLFEALGIAAVLTLPMVRSGKIVAVLSVQQATPRVWKDSEVELVRELADRTLSVLERAHSEERLAESEAQLAAFLENAPVAMHMKNEEGRYIRVNPEFARAFGMDREEIQGKHPDDLFPPAIAVELEAIESKARAGLVAGAEIALGGFLEVTHVLSMAFPITGTSGIARTGGFTLDLTEGKRAEAALAQSRETLYQNEKLSALGSLLAGVSHELNNPLSIVVAQAVMLERQSRGSELAERAQKIRKAADRCARIVQTFLAMARQKQPERAAVDLNAVAMAAHELADYGLKTDGIVTLRELTPSLPLISADSDQLHQIIINLIVNAQQAMVEAGTAERTLTLRTALGTEPGTVILDVADSGPGIAEEARRRVFEPFYTTKAQGQGTGVGLSFSQGLAEAHGGRLELASSNAGACFRLTLPIDPVQSLPAIPAELPLVQPAPLRRALVIDDEAEIAESLADFLSIEGFVCEVAVGGGEARDRLIEGEYDLIVSDLRMPDIDGPQLHAWIAAERPDLLPCVGFATGDTLGAAAARFLGRVKRPVLEKPFTPEAVTRFLEQMDLP